MLFGNLEEIDSVAKVPSKFCLVHSSRSSFANSTKSPAEVSAPLGTF